MQTLFEISLVLAASVMHGFVWLAGGLVLSRLITNETQAMMAIFLWTVAMLYSMVQVAPYMLVHLV
jgi:hypothetical protein